MSDAADETPAAGLGVGLPRAAGHLLAADHPPDLLFALSGAVSGKFGPRRLIAIGTVMAGMSWVLSAQVKSPATLWLVYGCMGGLGTGIVYIGVVG